MYGNFVCRNSGVATFTHMLSNESPIQYSTSGIAQQGNISEAGGPVPLSVVIAPLRRCCDGLQSGVAVLQAKTLETLR